MKQSQVNKFFSSMTSHQMLSNIASPTTTAPSKHRKNASSTISNGNKYLVYAKRTSRVLKDTSQKLPTLTSVFRTESQEIPKTAIQFTRKASNNSGDFRIHNQHHRNKTETITTQINTNISKVEKTIENLDIQQKEEVIPIIQPIIQTETIINTPIVSTRSELKFSQILHKVHMAAVVGEEYQFKKVDTQRHKIKKSYIKQQITEKESLNEKSCHLMRKLTQLLNSHRDKLTQYDLEQKRKKETIQFIDREFSHTISNMPDEKTPKISEAKFNQKLSTITKKQSKVNQNFSAQESESILPLKSIIDALKEKKEDKKDRKKVDLIQMDIKQLNVQKQATQKKLKITIVYEQNEQQTEFLLPDYINEELTNQEQTEIKESKQSNIYSLVSKSMLQNKFALRLVKKFGDKVIKTQEDNDAIENFNSFKASQFTRYYLQNHFQKCLDIKYDNQKEKEQFQNQNIYKQPILDSIIFQETFIEMLSKSTQQDQQNISNKIQLKKQIEITNHFYKLNLLYDNQQNENSLLSPSGSILDVSDIELQSYYKINYIYYQLNLVPVNDLRQSKLRVLVNTVDDETKNKFLHEELMQFPQIVNLVIIKEDDFEAHQLQIINDLEHQLHKKNQNKIIQDIANKYTKIQIGLFEDYFNHSVSDMEKIYIQYCRTVRDLDQNKLQKDRAKTEQVINLNIPQKSRSRIASPSGSSESKTLQKDHKEANPMIAKNMMLKKHQRTKNLLGTQKFETTSSQNFIGSVSNLQTLQNIHTQSQPQQRSQRVHTYSREPETKHTHKNSERNIAIKQNLVTQQSMDPFSLLFRSMLLQESQLNDRSTIDKVFSLIEDHRFQDLKDLLNHDQNIHINSQDCQGNTFLIFAARTGAHDIINYLLRQGADPLIKNNEGYTALQIAIQHLQYEAADEISKFGRSNSYISH